MAADAHAPTASEYIVHHLQHLQNIKQTSIVDFSVINLDSIVVAAACGVIGLFILWLAARKATAGVPGRFQAAVEMLVEMVDTQAKANIKNAESRKFIAPLARYRVFFPQHRLQSARNLHQQLIPHLMAE